ncbi:glycosyltransferase [Bacillus oleronius]|nr:glycosyltransferase [Heyndrickxia oleronia]MBU5211735.1 glycosyltransferase [Heyndrickxia oleronia]
MSNVENEIFKTIEDNDLITAKSLLKHHEQELSNHATYYFLQICFYIKKKNLLNAWLWAWRGLELFPEDNRLSHLMVEISQFINKKSTLYSNVNRKNNQSTSNHQLPLDLKSYKKFDETSSFSVLQGSIEIANQMNTLSKGLQSNNINSHTINYYPYYLNYESDYEWSLIGYRSTPEINSQLRRLTKELILNYDLFHFHWGTTLTLDWSDIKLLNGAKKKIIMQHWGSDIRLFSEAKKINPYAVVKNMNEDQIKRSLFHLSEQISHCIVSDMELYQYVKGYYRDITVIPSMINVNHYLPAENESKNKRLLIAHAPTSPFIKGTQYIEKAIEKLKIDYDFDFIKVQGLSHQKAMSIYKKADLIIDQLHIGSYGLFAVETMAMEKPVICWISDFMKEKYPKDLPIIIANPDTIKDTIEYALKNADMLLEIGKQGRDYVEKYHDVSKNSIQVLNLYKKLLSK